MKAIRAGFDVIEERAAVSGRALRERDESCVKGGRSYLDDALSQHALEDRKPEPLLR